MAAARRRLRDEAQAPRHGLGLLHLPRRQRRRLRRSASRVDASGNAYVTGRTSLDQLPDGRDALPGDQRRRHGRLRGQAEPGGPGAASLVYSTYLGGSADDAGQRHRRGRDRQRLRHGRTVSTNFPMGPPPRSSANAGRRYDAFVTKLNAAGSALVYSTYLGGSGDDRGSASPWTAPATPTSPADPLDELPDHRRRLRTGCGSDGNCNSALRRLRGEAEPGRRRRRVARLLDLSRRQPDDEAQGIAVDSAGRAHVTGWTDSTNFPTANALPARRGMGCGPASWTPS